MDGLWPDPEASASDILPQLDADFEAKLQQIKQEEE